MNAEYPISMAPWNSPARFVMGLTRVPYPDVIHDDPYSARGHNSFRRVKPFSLAAHLLLQLLDQCIHLFGFLLQFPYGFLLGFYVLRTTASSFSLSACCAFTSRRLSLCFEVCQLFLFFLLQHILPFLNESSSGKGFLQEL